MIKFFKLPLLFKIYIFAFLTIFLVSIIYFYHYRFHFLTLFRFYLFCYHCYVFHNIIIFYVIHFLDYTFYDNILRYRFLNEIFKLSFFVSMFCYCLPPPLFVIAENSTHSSKDQYGTHLPKPQSPPDKLFW